MKRIAVLLTVFNRKEKTLQCLRQLYAQHSVDGCTYDVYLTNDGCTDGTPEAVRQLYPLVYIIDANGNLFWNRGMYTAWKEAAKKDYDFYLWMNDDTFAYPYMLEELMGLSNRKEDKAIIVGATETSDKGEISYGGRTKIGLIPTPSGIPVEVAYFNGNIVLIPQYVFRILGNLDFYYTHSKGDFDYGIRARKAGVKMYQVGVTLGICDLHYKIDQWCDPEVSFLKRWQLMKRPNGMPPKETFHLEKQTNIILASIHFVTIILRCIFPSLWVKMGKAKLNGTL